MPVKSLSREEIILLVEGKQLKQSKAARLLNLSVRQVKRLCQQYREWGIEGLRSKKEGMIARNRISADIRKRVVELAQTKYVDFGPTFLSEKLSALEGIQLSKETIRKTLIEEKLWRPRKEKKQTIHQRRARRACFGELVQIDGSPHAWFEDRAPACCLIVFIDDATSQLLYLQFEPVETTLAYFRGMYTHIKDYGAPYAYYSDKHMIFRVSNAKVLDPEPTQFERACKSLGIKGICANSPQAKGRVERANKTLQDRLIKELRLQGIHTLEQGNAFLPHYIPLHNKKFSVLPLKSENIHQSIHYSDEELQHILSIQSIRKLSKNLELSFNNTLYQIVHEGKGRRLQQSRITVCQSIHNEIILLNQNKPLAYKTLISRTKISADDKSLNPFLDKQLEPKSLYKPTKEHPWRKSFKAAGKKPK